MRSVGFTMGFDNEDDVRPVELPAGVLEFVNDAIDTIAENTGTKTEDIIFNGLVLQFTVKGCPVSFQAMKIA